MYSGVLFLHVITEIRNLAPTVQRDWRLVSETQGLGVPLSKVGFPIRKFTDQSFFAAPHDLSQRSTSFIASQCQGIRQTPLLCLISQLLFVSEDRSHDRSSARSVQGTTPTTKTALYSTYPFLPLRLGDGARKSRLQTSLPMNDVKEQAGACRYLAPV